MNVTEVDAVSHRIPFSNRFPVSYESHGSSEHLFVRIRTDSGHVGYGEGTALPWFTGDVSEGLTAVVDRYLSPEILDVSLAEAVRRVDQFIEKFPGAPGAKAAVEMALLDLQAKRIGVPLSELFGVRMHDSVTATSVIPALEPDVVSDRVRDACQRGFTSFKVKADGDVETDIERIDAVTERLPPDGVVRVDANTSWRRFHRARNVVDSISQPEKIEYIEQPVAVDRLQDMKRLWEEFDIPVFADESISDTEDLIDGADSIAGCHLKLAKSGSLRRLVEMGKMASRRDLQVTVVSAFGTSLDATANLHLASVLDNLSAGAELCTGLIAEDPAEPSLPVSGEVDVPSRPGIGVELPDRLFESA